MRQTRQRLLNLGLAAICVFAAAEPIQAKPRKPLTCSFIAGRCNIECIKAAPATFCASYCADQRRMCLATGNWTGIQRSFSNVVRR
ncbi:MAG: hypothetical protein NW217_01180 [Hyphomicrobiaceae bacterium]|nr:hypothetical protein [Hyphomicrobiaceae bacterium]